MTNDTFSNPITLNHRGKAMYFVSRLSEAGQGEEIYYNVLNLKLESTDNNQDWDGYTELKFPGEVSVAGVNILRVKRPVVNKGFFQVVSDEQYIYIVRASSDALYINRYLLVEVPNPKIEGETKLELQPAWEVRFQRSGKPDTPLSDKDTQSFVNLDGVEFVEPVIELPLGWKSQRLDFSKAWFDVKLLPTNTSGVLRWLFLIGDQESGALLSYTIDRSPDGWFQFTKEQFDETNKLIDPDIAMGFTRGQEALKVAGPPVSTVYTKQEPVETSDSTVLRLQQAYRLMASCQLDNAEESTRLGVFDIAIANDGHLVYPPWKDRELPAPVDLGTILPASYGLRFDGEAWVSLEGLPLTLGTAFTQQIWVYSTIGDVEDHTILGSQDHSLPPAERPPCIWIKDRFRIGVGFGTGESFLSAETVENVLNSNSWNNILVVFEKGRYSMWVNGAPVQLKGDDFAGASPLATPLDGIGGRSMGQFKGDLAEVRIWSAARQAQALKYLYERIPPDEISQMPDLQAYYYLNEGQGTRITNAVASKDRPGSLRGAQWVSATIPVQPKSGPRPYVDSRGLAFYGGIIVPDREGGFPEFGNLAGGSRPYLLSSADGYLHLYYQGKNDRFLVAQYDTSNMRAHYGVWWIAGAPSPEKPQRGYLVISSRQTGTVFNSGKIRFTRNAQTGLLKLVLEDGQGGKETWNGLPPTVEYLVEVLSGRSVNDPGDRRLEIGERVFYDYKKERALGFHPVGDPLQHGLLQLISRNLKSFVFRKIGVKADPGGNTCRVDLTVALTGSPQSKTFSKTLLNVPVEVGEFAATLNGSSSQYDYADSGNTAPGGASFYEIPATVQSILVIVPDPDVVKLKADITPAAKRGECDLKIELELKSETAPLKAEWKGISRRKEAFVQAIQDSQTKPQQRVASYLEFFLRDAAGVVGDGVVDRQADLYAATSFLDVITLNPNGQVKDFELELAKIQSVDDNDDSRRLEIGSILFAFYNGRPADNGFPEVIDTTSGNTVDAELLQPGRDGGWIADSPHYSIQIDNQRASVEVPIHTATNKPLAIDGSLTLETWSNPTPLEESRQAVSVTYPRLIHAHLDPADDGTKYLVGTTYSAALQFLKGDKRGPAKIEVHDNAVPDTQDWLFPSGNYSASVYVKADLPTAVEAPGRLFEIRPLVPELPVQKLTVSKEGVLNLEIIQNGASTPHPFSHKLPNEKWTMVTISRQGETIHTYVDGEADIEIPITAYPATPAHHLLLVGDNQQSRPLEMQLNQVAVWQRPLGPEDVRSRYNQALPVDDESLILLWRLDAYSADDKIENDALTTGSIYDTAVSGFYQWQFPGVFLAAFAAVRDHAVITRGALLAAGAWNHVCAVYESHFGVRLTEQAYGDCGDDDNLNVDTGLTLEAWVNQLDRVVGANQVIFSKFSQDPVKQCYEFGINGDNRPYIQLRLQGRKDLKVENKKVKQVDVPEKDLYFTITGERQLSRDQAYYLAAAVSISSEGREVEVDGVKEQMNVYNLHAQVYVNGEPSGPAFDSVDMYGEVTANKSKVAANFGRTKPDAPVTEQSYYSGELSDLRLWNRALTPDAVKSNYQSIAQQIKGDGLVSAWYFREQEGRTAFDSESENNATLSNRDLWIPFHGSSVLRMVLNGREVPLLKRQPSDFGGYEKPQITFGSMRNAVGAYRNTFVGKMDEFRVWSEVRTLEQIRDNKERFLVGNEANLAGYWRFNSGSGNVAVDETGLGNNGVLTAFDPGNLPRWRPSEAPISNEAGIVLNALGGVDTRFLATITAGPAVVEYADTQLDFKREAFSIYKRCYVYLDRNGVIRQDTSFKVGDLSRVYLGQVQSKPSLIGYIEGAPPLPSENLTRPYYDSPTAYSNYNKIASVTLAESDATTLNFSSTRQSGSQLAFGIKAGYALGYRVDAGAVVVSTTLSEGNFSIGPAFDLNWSTTESKDTGITYGVTKSNVNSLSNTGDWDPPDSSYQRKTGERRYLPANTGYALVKSMTADMYALYLKTTGAMVGFSILPNLDIPIDNNIIYFPIDPEYIKNGTLDGRVGLETDPGARGDNKSYFRPVEAYTLKRKIEKQEQDLLAYYQQFNAVKRGQAQKEDLSKTIEENPVFNFEDGKPRLNLVNQYVWTSASGFFTEKESATAIRQETHSGVYSFKWNLGFTTQGKFLFGSGVMNGFYFDANLMGGTQWTVTVKKSKSEAKSFGLDVTASPETFLRRYLPGQKPLYSEKDTPGKVNTYRFFSFYLSPEEESFDHFFSKVVDKAWLRSDDPRAVALREARANPNPPWRILHRVTFVSRIPPEFQPFPLDTQAPDTNAPPNLLSNGLLLQMVADRIGGSDPTPAEIGKELRKVVELDLVRTIPWWKAFLEAAQVENSPESVLLGELTRDMISYLIEYYETKPASEG